MGGLPGYKYVLQVVADVQTHLTIDILSEKGVLVLHFDVGIGNCSVGSSSRYSPISVCEGLLIIDKGQVERGFELVYIQLGL